MKIYESNVQIAVAFFSTFLLYSNGPNPNYAALGGLFYAYVLEFLLWSISISRIAMAIFQQCDEKV